MKSSYGAALVVAAVLSLAAPSPLQAKNATFGEYVRAARLLSQWRYEEARSRIGAIAKRWPDAAETHYLQAELAFVDGAYKRSLESLDKISGKIPEGLDSQVRRLRSLVGSTIVATNAFTSRESAGGHFIIYYPPGKDEVIVDLAGDVLERAYERLGKDFDYRPTGKIRVELLSRPADLAKVSSLTEKEIKTTGTIALCKYGKLMVVTPRATMFGYPWMDTIVHEYVHYVVSRLSHDEVPVWLHEGLARFEQTRWRSAPGVKLSTTDEHLLATALSKNKLVPFKKMHPSMAKLPSAEAASLAFAEVYTMVGYLQQSKGYAGLREVIAKTKKGKSAQRAVGELMGTRWRNVERAWKKHLRASGLKTSRAFAGRAHGPRVRFAGDGNSPGGKKSGKRGGDRENVGAEAVANTKARKFTRLGGLLRARDMTAAAVIEYEKALAAAPRDPFISGKLSRSYLELERYDEAIAIARPLADADEDDSLASATLGIAYGATGRAEESARFLERALRVNPFDPAVRCGLATAYQNLAGAANAVLAAREQRACTTLRTN